MRLRLAAAVAAPLLMTACGAGGGADTATDPAEGDPSTPSPTVGAYPAFEPEDYIFTLRVSCFCPDSDVPIRVTVADGEVAGAVYAEGGPGHRRGAEVDRFLRLTIDDVIAAANNTEADEVVVSWPEGQDYPDSVRVDQDEMAMDEEIGYAVSDVVVGS